MCIRDRISRSHSLSLSRTDEASVKRTFTHQFWRGVTAVSYTHLDVYKRQDQP
ncbi:hypothetical protein [Erwinia amylovora]